MVGLLQGEIINMYVYCILMIVDALYWLVYTLILVCPSYSKDISFKNDVTVVHESFDHRNMKYPHKIEEINCVHFCVGKRIWAFPRRCAKYKSNLPLFYSI
jgi:hypothetical protein